MNKKLAGATLALTVAAMFVAGKAMADQNAAGSSGDNAGKIKCSNANGCKGKGDCHAKDGNGCAGKNGCKGKGWNWTKTEKECTDKGGKVIK